MTEFNLVDFLPEILDPQQDDFSLRLANQYQFAQYASLPSEPRPKVGERYRWQNFSQEFFSIFRDALIYGAPGIGKSCAATAVAETLKQILAHDLSPPVKRVYLLTRGPVLSENFQQEIVCRCTKNIYNNVADETQTYKTQVTRVNAAIKKYYEFMSYGKFAEYVESLDEEFLAEYMSNVLIIIDEAHNLIAESAEPGTKVSKKKIQKTYNTLKNFFHKAPGRKLMLLTATPMRNGPDELGKLLNLILPEDSQIPEKNGHLIKGKTQEELWPYFRGLIYYLREMSRQINIIYHGVPLSKFIDTDYQTIVYPCLMEKFQADAYREVVQNSKRRGVYINPRQAANFVFPDGSSGKEGFTRYILKPPPKDDERRQSGRAYATRDFYEFSEEFKDYFRDKRGNIIQGKKFVDRVRNLSSVFAKTLEYALENPNKKFIDYEEFKDGSGVFVLGLLFELGLGYQILTNSFLEDFRQENNYCAGNEDITQPISVAKRIGILTTEIRSPNRKVMINMFNSPNNIGENLRVSGILYTPVGREGLSFNNVEAIFLKGTWSPATEIQAEKRGLRANSHYELLELLEGKVQVDVYHLIIELPEPWENVLPGTRAEPDTIEEEPKEESDEEESEEEAERIIEMPDSPDDMPSDQSIYNVDLHMFAKAEDKYREIEPIDLMVQQMCLNCFNDRARNQQDDEVNIVPFYDCQIGPDEFLDPMQIDYDYDYSWFWRYPSQNLIQETKKLLDDSFLENPIVDIDFLLERLKQPEQVILSCLTYLWQNQVMFETRWGIKGFLTISSTSVGVSPRYHGQIEDSLYLQDFRFQVPPTSWRAITSQKTIERKSPEIEKYFKAPESLIRDYIAQLYSKPLDFRNALLETAFTMPNNPMSKALIEHYRPRWFEIDYEGKNWIVSKLLSAIELERSQHAATKKLLTPQVFRIFEQDGNKWRDPTPEENHALISLIEQEMINRERDLLDSHEIYGFRIIDDPKEALRVVDPSTEEETSHKHRKTGSVCINSPISTRANYFWKLGILVSGKYPRVSIDEMKNRLDAMNIRYREDDENQIEYLYAWYMTRKDSKQAKQDCEEIEKVLVENNRLIYR